jgi:pimeloyl-ACP methyl ester carboxylesterase
MVTAMNEISTEPTRAHGMNLAHAPQTAYRGRVIALHCSGAGASQWCHLAEALGSGFEMRAPEHYGCDSAGAWSGQHAFTLADEAARTIGLIDKGEGRVHLVGHSYGGGVALHVALARPHRIASMVLYEPSAFHLLPKMGKAGAAAYAEIASIVRRVCQGIISGDYQAAAKSFVNYWNGAGAWDLMRPSVRDVLMRWAPKAPLDFRALMADETESTAYQTLDFPVLILRGEHAPLPTRLIADRLPLWLPRSSFLVINGAGHMGPLTHASEVAALMARHIADVQRQQAGVRILAA